MTPRQRKAHLIIWLMLTPVLIAALVVAWRMGGGA